MPIVFLSFLSFFKKIPLHRLFSVLYSKHRTNETTTTTERKKTMQLLTIPRPSFLSANEQAAPVAFIPDFSTYAQRRFLPALRKNSNFIKKLIANIETAKDSDERAESWDRLLKTLARFTDKLLQLGWESCDEQSGALVYYLTRNISGAWCFFRENGYNNTNYHLIHKLTEKALLCLYACDCKALESFSDTLTEIKQRTN